MKPPFNCRITGPIIAKEFLRLARDDLPVRLIGVNNIERDTTRVFIPFKPGFEYDNNDTLLSLDDFSAKHIVPLVARHNAGETSSEVAPSLRDWEVWESWK